jgi:hypothetical protein
MAFVEQMTYEQFDRYAFELINENSARTACPASFG